MEMRQIEITPEVDNLLNKEQAGDESYSEVILRMAAELAEYRDHGLIDRDRTENTDNASTKNLPEEETDQLPEEETELLPEPEDQKLPVT